MDVVLQDQFGERHFALGGSQRHVRFQSRGVVPARLSRHLLSRSPSRHRWPQAEMPHLDPVQISESTSSLKRALRRTSADQPPLRRHRRHFWAADVRCCASTERGPHGLISTVPALCKARSASWHLWAWLPRPSAAEFGPPACWPVPSSSQLAWCPAAPQAYR